MDGPPMSMFSTASSNDMPGRLMVIRNGYRLTATRSMGTIPRSWSAVMWAGMSRRPSRAPCTAGCRVFTRPSSSSGRPVTSSTDVTAMPAERSAVEVPPVEMISQPSWVRPCANATMPRLSLTEISARGMTSQSRGGLHGFGKRHGVPGRRGRQDDGRQQAMLDREHARGQRLGRIVRTDGHPSLREDPAAVVHLVHQVHRSAAFARSAREDGLVDMVAVHPAAAEAGEEGRVHVQDAVAETGDDGGGDELEI